MAKSMNLNIRRSTSNSVPKFSMGGGQNALMSMMMAQSMLPQKVATQKAAESEAASYERGNLANEVKKVGAQFKGGRPEVNSSMKSGDVTYELNPKIGVEEARSLGMSDAIGSGIGYLMSEQKRDPEAFRDKFSKATARLFNEIPGMIGPFSTTLGDNQAGIIKDYLNDMRDRILRLRSGAQINEQEMKRMVTLLPTWEDVQDLNEPIPFDRLNRKLAKFATEMNALKQRIISGRSFDDNHNPAVYDPATWGEDLNKTIEIPVADKLGFSATPPPQKSPIPGMDQQIGADPLDELRKEFLKK